jgi:hypothetical protein
MRVCKDNDAEARRVSLSLRRTEYICVRAQSQRNEKRNEKRSETANGLLTTGIVGTVSKLRG